MARWITGPLAVFLFLAGIVAPADASPTVIARLGAAPLLGSSTSTVQLRSHVEAQGARVASAAAALGLSAGEYRAFRAALFARRLPWGILPRHLDAMAFYREDGVHVLHDVIIPTKTYGWEVDIAEPGETVRVLVPATCGNLSVLRAFRPAVATNPVRTRVAASVQQTVPVTPTPTVAPATPAPVASPTQTTESPSPTPTPTPTTVAAATPPPATHHLRWPWVIPIVLLFFFHGGSGGGGSPPPSGGGCGCGCIPPLP